MAWSFLLLVEIRFGLFCLRWKSVWSLVLKVSPVRKLDVAFLTYGSLSINYIQTQVKDGKSKDASYLFWHGDMASKTSVRIFLRAPGNCISKRKGHLLNFCRWQVLNQDSHRVACSASKNIQLHAILQTSTGESIIEKCSKPAQLGSSPVPQMARMDLIRFKVNSRHQNPLHSCGIL